MKHLQSLSIVFLLLLLPFNAMAGGYEFLLLPQTARHASRAETGVALGHEPGLTLQNPAALALNTGPAWSTSWGQHFGEINQFALNGIAFWRNHPLQAGMTMLHYGTFDGRDLNGNPTGEFSVQDYQFFLTSAGRYQGIAFGATIKLVYSRIEEFQSQALAFSGGLRYTIPETHWHLGAAILDAGTVLQKYTENSTADLPRRLELGLARELRYLPLTWELDYRNMENEGSWRVGLDIRFPIGWHLRGGYRFAQNQDRLDNLNDWSRGISLGVGGPITSTMDLDFGYHSHGEVGSVYMFTFGHRLNQSPTP